MGVTEELNALLHIRVESLYHVPGELLYRPLRIQTEGDLVVMFLPLEPSTLSAHGWERLRGLPQWLSDNESACQRKRHGFSPWVKKIPSRREWQPTPIFLPEEFHGQRRLAGYSLWGCKELGMT